jgi:penicillin-binding protein 1A
MKRKILSIIFTPILLLVIFAAAVISFIVFHFSKDLPNYQKSNNYKLCETTRVYSGNNNLIAEFAYEKRIFTPIDNIPENLINAFLAAEDKNFYTNPGIDIISIIRAALSNISGEENLAGGSTITQQVVKNFLLSPEKTMKRKIQEAIIAFRINKIFTKDEILELYLNKIYFGHGAYGVTYAALTYFNKKLDDLTLAEIALLAALPKAPSKLDPTKNPDKVIDRRNWIITRMFEENLITEEQVIDAKSEDLSLNIGYFQNKFDEKSFYIDDVKRELIQKYGEDKVYCGGLTVKTTLDENLQKKAVEALKKGLIDYDRTQKWHGKIAEIKNLDNWIEKLQEIPLPYGAQKNWEVALVLKKTKDKIILGLKSGEKIELGNKKWVNNIYIGDVVFISEENHIYSIQQIPEINGGIIVMDNQTGNVLALVGGYDYNINQFNVATQALRQPGSLFKPFVYLAALENNFTPTTIIDDSKVAIEQGPNMPLWEPKNYENKFFGPTSLREGLEKSRNITTVQIAKTVGIDQIIKLAQRFDILKNAKEYYSTVLGAYEVKLVDMVKAYAIFANSGKKLEANFLQEVTNNKGDIIYQNQELKDNFLISPEHAYQMISLLEGAVKSGTARRLKNLNITIAAKTGTTNDTKDAWTIALVPNLTVGVYVGYDTPKSLGEKTSGGRVALPIVYNFMKSIIDENYVDIPFKVPDGVVFTKIDKETGNLALPFNRSFTEVFVDGTEPYN